jgi:ATP-binding cassette subfamily C (CFTR/MRP) protein 1
VLLRYTKNSDLVLKGLNVNIKGGEKVGIVGRTGAGKSTLANAVTRIVEICGGTIEFDGVDICKVNMDQVRESITIIPQDPTLFKGTIKFNMDPTGKCTDQEIEKVLKDAELDKLIFKKKEESEKEKKEKMDKI